MEDGTWRNFFAVARFGIFLLLFVSCFCQVAASTRSLGVNSTQPKRASVLSLFNLDFRKSRFWNEAVLGRAWDDYRMAESQGSSKEARQNYTKAGTLARYLKLETVHAIHLPLPINFIFIGFHGEGNQGLTLGEEELGRWFTNIDHILEHTRIPQLEEALSPFYHVKGSGQRRHLPLVSYTHYNYSVHAVELQSQVTAVFERAIKVLSRKENISDSRPDAEVLWQVDMDGMNKVFSSLISFLQLEKAYNIFVLNPKRDPSVGQYGYRYGLSEAEIAHIREDSVDNQTILAAKEKVHDYLEVEKTKNPLYNRHPLTRFSWTTADSENTAGWVEMLNQALESLDHSLKGKTDSDRTVLKVQQLLDGNKHLQTAYLLRRALKGDESSGLEPECLVDAWVGQDRWSFIDLTAGPFTWGPTVAGDGVRTEQSLPSVESTFGRLTVTGVDDDYSVHEDFQKIWQDRFSTLEENEDHEVDMLLAELDVYETFAFKHCRGRKVVTILCEELQERLKDVRVEIEVLENATDQSGSRDAAHQQKAAEALKRIDEWNVFGSIQEHTQNFSVARDSFLAHLGAVLSSSMKHVVTPSTSDGAFHYYETIYFQLYIITQDKYKDTRLLPVDVLGLKAALSELLVPLQKIQFGVTMLALSEDPALAMAFASAKRAAVVPVLLVNGTYKATHRLYLDTHILQHELKQLKSLSERKLHGRSSVEVPIFWFVRSSYEPLLIDKHYLAKALPDMVIVAQSSNSAWESHLQCNGRPIFWDLRKPTKAAIAAVAEHLAGLMPSHLTYSMAHENADQDWMWSVGSHPFSCTSAGWHVSAFQTDAMARSYLINTLDESIEIVNSATDVLAREYTRSETFEAFRSHESDLAQKYNGVVNLWKGIASMSADLRYGDAMKMLSSLETQASSFLSATNATIAALHPVSCTKKYKFETQMNLAAGLAVSVVIIVMWLLLRPKRVKPKIN